MSSQSRKSKKSNIISKQDTNKVDDEIEEDNKEDEEYMEINEDDM